MVGRSPEQILYKLYPDATVDFESSLNGEDAPSTRVADRELVELALAVLVENAITRCDRGTPRVTVRITADDDVLTAHVIDNGPSITNEQRDALHSRTETNLRHGSGLGLWLVKWTVSLSDGALSVPANEPRGNVVSLTFPTGPE